MNKKQIFTAITIPSILIIVNIFLAVQVVILSPAFLIENKSYISQHQTITSYLLLGNETKLQAVLPKDEYQHIKDVRNVLISSGIALIILILVIIATNRTTSANEIYTSLKWSAIMLPLVTLCILLIFNQFFTTFHHILFPQGNWSFPPNSILIQLYPEQFWLTITGLILGTTFLELIVCLFLANKLKRTT